MPNSLSTILGFEVGPDMPSGLLFGVGDGILMVGGRWVKVGPQTILLHASATNFVEIGAGGGLAVNTSAFTTGANFLYVVTTDATGVTGIQDWKYNPTVGSPSTLSASATGGVGYTTGAGGVVTQGAGSGKTTAFTLSKVTGTITTDNASLASATSVSATWTNTTIAITDTVVINHVSGGTAGAYTFTVAPGAGTAVLTIRNILPATAEAAALVLQYNVIKGAAA
jgi:hypothetical protein